MASETSMPNSRAATATRSCLLRIRRQMKRPGTLETDLLDQIFVGDEPLLEVRGPGTRVRLGVIHGEIDLQRPEVRSSKALGERRGVGQRVARHVEPQPIAQAVGLHDQRVALPSARRVAVPRGLWIDG